MSTSTRRRHSVRSNRGRRHGRSAPLSLSCDAANGGKGSHPGSLDDLPAAVLAARRLLGSGRRDAASELLATHLRNLDVSWLPDDPVLVDACTLYAPLADDDQQILLARYAHDAAGRLHGPYHSRRLAAAESLARALHVQGNYEAAIEHGRDLVATYERLGLRSEALLGRTALAGSLHAASRCDQAGQVTAEAWETWLRRPVQLGGAPVGAAVLSAHLTILFGCRRPDDLAVVFEQACRVAVDIGSDSLRRRPLDAHAIATHRSVCAYQDRQG